MTAATRTQAEILARLRDIADADFFGFRSEVLLFALDFDHAGEYLKAEVGADDWNAARPADLEQAAKDYYGFALGKIRGHRGISAESSVEKLGEYAWLLGRDDIVTAMDAAEYPQYGAPKVKAFADGLGLVWPDEPEMARMAAGEPCVPGCAGGCGL